MQTQLYIDGRWRDGADGTRIQVHDPATSGVIAEVADGRPADAVEAVEAAARAQTSWASATPRHRSDVLHRCWRAMLDDGDTLTDLIVNEHGKPRADAAGEVAYAAEFFRWNAEEAVRISGSLARSPSGGNRILVHHPPVGVVAIITPWNFPAAMITRKLAPALAAGNGAVIKPAAQTPLTALRIAELITDAGVPPGLVNIVPTSAPGEWLDATVDQRAVRMLSFTGSTEVGRLLLRRAADRVFKTVMELGGNAPFVVFDDADLDAAVGGAMVAKMRHSAETCTAANRFLVHDTVADDFAERLAEAMGAVRLGSGFEDGVECGPLIDRTAVDRVAALVDDARSAGATALVGGQRFDRPGYFYEPTVLTGVHGSWAIARSEIFGPVAPIIRFHDDDEAVAMSNDTEMGLTAYVYTQDLARGLAVSERLEAGMVGLNRGAVSDVAAPFGGMKQSGLGREGASEGILEFCETQYIAAEW
ncbi:MAG: NAD-dependent succinate-semialdehyde dehydrogenase [Ilumatobacter sp.]|uniref:NAD-dependent succinate-semialdehyde dehydrogenase n=1 Tax=Ilumatobacter sp. TaxID=1967498 RepID=UPI00391A5DEC